MFETINFDEKFADYTAKWADQHRKEDGSPQYRYALGANAHFFSELKQLTHVP